MNFINLAEVDSILKAIPKNIRVCSLPARDCLPKFSELTPQQRCNLAKVVAKQLHYREVSKSGATPSQPE